MLLLLLGNLEVATLVTVDGLDKVFSPLDDDFTIGSVGVTDVDLGCLRIVPIGEKMVGFLSNSIVVVVLDLALIC